MKQQTAVEQLIEEIERRMILIHVETNKPTREVMILNLPMGLERFKEIEKEQIIDADLNATIRTAKGANADVSVRRVKELGEQYYNETYGGNK